MGEGYLGGVGKTHTDLSRMDSADIVLRVIATSTVLHFDDVLLRRGKP